MSVPWATTNPAAYSSPPSTRTTSRAASSDARRDSSDCDSSDNEGAPPRITGEDDDSDVELMSALNGSGGGVGGRMRAGSSQPRSFATGAGSDSDGDIPPPPMHSPPSQQTLSTPTKANGTAATTAGDPLHTRRKRSVASSHQHGVELDAIGGSEPFHDLGLTTRSSLRALVICVCAAP